MTFSSWSSSSPFRAVFAAGVAVVECREEGRPEWLLPEEYECVAHSVRKRVNEFAAGRACARRALFALGGDGSALCADEDRCPLWPDGFVGSITHTTGFCAASVARSDTTIALGIDAEIVSHVVPALWPAICSASERIWLEALPSNERQAMAAVIFSAKEAFYKYQYARTREWLDFHDLALRPSNGRLAIDLHKPLAIPVDELAALSCNYVLSGDLVVTGIAGMPSKDRLVCGRSVFPSVEAYQDLSATAALETK